MLWKAEAELFIASEDITCENWYGYDLTSEV
jgi:hypothetical protein